MKIVNLTEFLALPGGTLFCRYEPVILGSLEIKEESRSNKDFYSANLVGTEDDFVDSMFALEDGKVKDIPIDCEGFSRDGLFEDDAKFLIFTKKDIWKIAKVLDTALEVAPEE